MSLSFILRRLLLIALLTSPQWFWIGRGWKLSGRIKRFALRWLSRTFLICAVMAMALVLYDRISGKFLPEALSMRVAPIVQLWIFASTFAFFCILLLRLLARILSSLRRVVNSADKGPSDPNRRSTLRYSISLLGSMPFLAAVYGYAFERLSFEVVRKDLPVANLPAGLDGLRIVQLSDIHIGDSFPVSQLRRAVAMANRLEADLTVITGDFVTSYGDPLEACIAELSMLKAPLGVWGCNGNHEIYAGAEEDAERLFGQYGMRLLRQAAVPITRNGTAFNLIGVDYQHNVPITGTVMPSLQTIEPLVRRDIPNILLSHNPNTFFRAAELGIELSLAGHTHGGQVNIEIIHRSWNPARFMTRFISGLYELPMPAHEYSNDIAVKQSALLYVNRGLGTLALPARIGATPEITLLTLRSDQRVSLRGG